MRLRGEDELWEFLELWVNTVSESTAAEQKLLLPGSILDESWTPRLLYFPTEPPGHSISPSTAKAIQEFYQALARSYAYLLYNEPNATYLHDDDKSAIEFRAIVTSGSSGIELPPEQINHILEGLIGKMSGEQALIGIVVFLLLFFSASVARAWLNEHYNARKEASSSDERLKLSEQETKRSEILAKALTQSPTLKPLSENSDAAKEALVRAATKVDRSAVMGTELDSETAQVILSKRRQKGEGKRLEGKFEFIWIGNEHDGGFLGRVKSFPDNTVFSVEINYMDLTADDMRAVFDSLEQKAIVNAHINAWHVGGKIVRAVVMKAESS